MNHQLYKVVALTIVVHHEFLFSVNCQLLPNIRDYATLEVKYDEKKNNYDENKQYMTVALTEVKSIIHY